MIIMLTFAIVYILTAFLLFWILYFGGRYYINRISRDKETYQLRFVLYHRVTGFLLFGLIPVGLGLQFFPEYWNDWGLLLDNIALLSWWTFSLVVLMIPFNLYVVHTKVNQQMYPQMRLQTWTPLLFILNALQWMLYLVAYEFLFRGLLFFSSIQALPLWLAIAVNAVIYALVHIPKGRREILGAIPFGILLCLGCYYTGSFWFAFFIHTFQAVFNEYHSIKANPAMHFKGEQAEEMTPSGY